MKLLFKLSFFLLFISVSYSNNSIGSLITLPKKFKVIGTFSGELSKKKSLHLIFSKNKTNKMHTVHIYFANANTITEFGLIENKNKLKIESFHEEKNEISLFLSYKNKKHFFLKKINIDITNKTTKNHKSTNHKYFITSVKDKNKSIFIYKNQSQIVIRQFNGIENVKTFSYKFNKNRDLYRFFFNKKTIEPIKTNEFIANGSTSNLRIYLDKNTLIFTKENTNNTKVVTFPLNNEQSFFSKIKEFSNKKKGKKNTSFYYNDKIYQFANNKNEGSVKIHNIKTNKSKLINLNYSLAFIIKGNNTFSDYKNFLKQASKNKNNTTITVNPTKKNRVSIRLDYVNKNYKYNYDWSLWHHQQFIMHQQIMINNIRSNIHSRFGPNQQNDFHFNNYYVKKERKYFEILLDNEDNLINDNTDSSLYNEIDKQKYFDRLEEIPDLKYKSSCFFKNHFRYIGYFENLKGFMIQTKQL